VLLALAATAAAGAAIVPSKGIAGVEVGMTPAKVKKILGVPDLVNARTDAKKLPEIIWGYEKRGIGIIFSGKPQKVTLVGVGHKGERLPSGLGVGSHEADLRERFPRLACGEQAPGYRYCWLGRKLKGKVVTVFYIPVAVGPVKDRRIVSNVSVGYVKFELGDPFTGQT
jgi:hypothetical protein